MPAKSKQQLKLIWAIRNKYGSKSKAPKKWKWVFAEEWGHLAKESHILNFNHFNEAMGTLRKEDTELIEDLILEFVESYKLSDERVNGYYQIQRFDPFHLHLSFRVVPFDTKEEKEKFESDLNKVLNRIEKFGFNVLQGAFGMRFSNRLTYSFQISHTDEKSNSILNESISEFYNIISESDYINELKNVIPINEKNIKIIKESTGISSFYSTSRNKYHTLANIPQYPIISTLKIDISMYSSIIINELKDEWFITCYKNKSNKILGDYTIFYKCDQIDGVIKLINSKKKLL